MAQSRFTSDLVKSTKKTTWAEYLSDHSDRFADEVKFVLQIAAILALKKQTFNPVITLTCLQMALIEVGRNAKWGFYPVRWLVQVLDAQQTKTYNDIYADYIVGDVSLDMRLDQKLLEKTDQWGFSNTVIMVLEQCLESNYPPCNLVHLIRAVFDIVGDVVHQPDRRIRLEVLWTDDTYQRLGEHFDLYMPLRINTDNQIPDKNGLFITSVNSKGTAGTLNQIVLSKAGFSLSDLPNESQLANGFYHLANSSDNHSVLFIVTLDYQNSPVESLERNLYRGLNALDMFLSGRHLWVPLLGTGTADISFDQSFDVIVAVLKNHLKGSEYRPAAIEIAEDPATPSSVETYLHRQEQLETALGFATYLPLVTPTKVTLKPNTMNQVIVGYTSDGVSGDKAADHLKIRHEVHPIANVLCAKTLTPPMAIGLFGDWGSGKSFFIQQLKDEISEIVAFVKDSEDKSNEKHASDFYSHIPQIEFNAWHYSEGDLWASLVEHIFSELRTYLMVDSDKDNANKQMDMIVGKLETNLA
ncbi:MAG: KAP family NTPase, partial [Psychrosphaera sp.]|nr:KAP family NTPase [Psychrosphaera sp.]